LKLYVFNKGIIFPEKLQLDWWQLEKKAFVDKNFPIIILSKYKTWVEIIQMGFDDQMKTRFCSLIGKRQEPLKSFNSEKNNIFHVFWASTYRTEYFKAIYFLFCPLTMLSCKIISFLNLDSCHHLSFIIYLSFQSL